MFSISRADDLIPAIRSFLCHDLCLVSLPPSVESKRQALIEQLDILSLGPTPCVPKTTTATPLPLPTSTVQRRPLSSVVRLFAASRKRYSLPASISYPNPVPETNEPPLPPKTQLGTNAALPVCSDQAYEVPRNLSTSAMSDGPPTIGHVRLRRYPFSRHSLSPQLEVIPSADDHGIRPPEAVLNATAAVNCPSDTALTLPKKCFNTQARRFSAFIDPSWTLAGSLHHRYKPNKWTRLNVCVLTAGSRLIAYKSSHALNPSLVIFLCGATGIYARRDSGQEFVIKIAHPTRGTTVLAADTEEQASAWIRQINQYAQGITPTETLSFVDHHPVLLSPPVASQSVLASSSRDHVDQLVKRSAKPEDDSGFSAPVSSGSEGGNSGDGIVRADPVRPTSLVLTSRCVSSATLAPGLTNTVCSTTPGGPVDHLNTSVRLPTENVACCPPQPASSSSSSVQSRSLAVRHTLPASSNFSLRRGGLFSSMRRKMESFNSKRRARKSLTKSFVSEAPTCATESPPSSVLATAVVNPPPSSGYRLPTSPILPTGFDWAQLDAASTLFSRVEPTVSTLLQRLSAVEMTSNLLLASQQGYLRDIASVQPNSLARDDRIIVSGEAHIAVPGRLPWTTRWCRLRSHCLEIFPTVEPPSSSTTHVRLDVTGAAAAVTTSPVFSLTLEPGQVELGLAGDKRHKAALRLAVPKQTTTSLLFDAPDKLQMGTWIRGFIEALGIIGTPTEKLTYVIETGSAYAEYDVPEYTCSPSAGGGLSNGRPSSYLSSNAATADNSSYPLSSHVGSLSLYDDVCSTSTTTNSSHPNSMATRYKRRWSSPADSSFSAYDVPHTAAPDQSPASSSWYIPPPSRRLLAQPLPPLPSMGPSGAESIAGTIDSSLASPDEPGQALDKQLASSAVDSEAELTGYARPRPDLLRRHLHSDHSQTSTSPAMHDQPRQPSLPRIHRRHASVGSLDYRLDHGNAGGGTTTKAVDQGCDTTDGVTTTEATLALETTKCSTQSRGTSPTPFSGIGSNSSVTVLEDTILPTLPVTEFPSTCCCCACWPEDAQLRRSTPRRSVSCINDPTQHDPPSFIRHLESTVPARRPALTPGPSLTPAPAATLENAKLSSPPSSNIPSTSQAVVTTTGSPAGSSQTSISPPSSPEAGTQVGALEQTAPVAEHDECGNSEKPKCTFHHKPLIQRHGSVHCATTNKSNRLAGALKRADTVTAGERETTDSAEAHFSPDMTYSPTNTSLVLVATQLEEVQHGAKRLRSRHDALSFRLTNRMAREQLSSTTAATSSVEQPIPPPPSLEPDDDDGNTGSQSVAAEPSKVVVDGETEEATESLRARLSAIEVLIHQAETMETLLRAEMSKYLANTAASMTGVSVVTSPVPETRSQCSSCQRVGKERANRNPQPNQAPPGESRPPRGRGRGGGRARRRRHGGAANRGGGGAHPTAADTQQWVATPRTPPNCSTLVPAAL